MQPAHLVGGPLWVVVEEDLKLVGAPGVVQQGRGKVLTLPPERLK